MLKKIIRIIFLVLLIFKGLLLISNIYVLENREAAIEMHEDLAPTATAFTANVKVLVCFVTGILYLITAYGMIRKKYALTLAGIIAFLIFDGFYIIELAMWGNTNPYTWVGFGTFGIFAIIVGVYSFLLWKKRKT